MAGSGQTRFPQTRFRLAFGTLIAETPKQMAFAKFSWRRLGAAFALALLLEALLLVAMIALVNTLPDKLADPIGNLLQAPASYLVPLLARVQRPGFEEQVGYVLLIPVIQWLAYAPIIYVWLARRKQKGRSISSPEEVPGTPGRIQ